MVKPKLLFWPGLVILTVAVWNEPVWRYLLAFAGVCLMLLSFLEKKDG